MRKKVAGNRTPPYVNTIVALMARPVIRKGGRAARDPLFNCIQLFSIAALNNFQLAKSPDFFFRGINLAFDLIGLFIGNKQKLKSLFVIFLTIKFFSSVSDVGN